MEPARKEIQLSLLPAYPSDFAVGIRPSCAPQPDWTSRSVPGPAIRWHTTVQGNHGFLYPRGPRSGPGYSVPTHHRLTDPMRPTHGHILISPQCSLYKMPSLCGSASATREWFRAFTICSFSTCRPLRPRRVHRLLPSSMPTALAFTQLRRVRHSRRWIFRGCQFAYATTCRVASLLLRRLLPGFQRLGHPYRCRI